MREIYVILGWVGWLWLPCALMFALGYWKGERDFRRRMAEGQVAGVGAKPQMAGGTTTTDSGEGVSGR